MNTIYIWTYDVVFCEPKTDEKPSETIFFLICTKSFFRLEQMQTFLGLINKKNANNKHFIFSRISAFTITYSVNWSNSRFGPDREQILDSFNMQALSY